MDLRARLAELAKISKATTPVVSVYLNTRWADEHQRDRVRIFLKNELAQARRGPRPWAAAADLDWVEAQGQALVSQTTVPEADGVALFACEALGLRDVLPVRMPFEDTFVVDDAPHLRPLAALSEEVPTALVVFIDTESARLVPLTPAGPGEEVALESEVPGRHSRGGWAQMAQSRYQRHIQDHRARHFEAVAESLIGLVESHHARHIVLAGDPRNVAVFRQELPPRLARHIVGAVAGARHESADVIVARAAALLPHVEGQREAEELDAVLVAAAKGGKAVKGVEATLAAVNRRAVHRLYVLRGFSEPGRVCTGCGVLQRGFSWTCRACGKDTAAVELGEVLTGRVMAAGGTVETIEAHQPLAAAGGIAARLRYPP